MDIDLIKNLDTQHLLTSLYNPTFKPLLVPPRKWHARESVTSRRGRVVGGPSDGGYLLLRSQFMERTVRSCRVSSDEGEIGSCLRRVERM